MRDPKDIPDSPMRGRYLIRNRKWNCFFRFVDFLLALGFRGKGLSHAGVPGRLLFANSAHVGDVILSTSLLPVVKSAFPGVKIGFLVGSWSVPVVRNHPLVDSVHVIDHWWGNRNAWSTLRKVRHYWKTRKTALREIRQERYDTAIDLYSFFPNLIPVLWQAGIPVRIGYVSGGFGPLLTQGIPFRQDGRHEAEYQAELLRQLPVEERHFREQRATLPGSADDAAGEVCRVLSVKSLQGCRYRVVHMGSVGSALREWPLRSWRILAERLTSEGHRLVFTGIGEYERRNIEAVGKGLKNCSNVCDKLRWQGFVEILRHAEIVYSVETSAGHIAAAADVPCVGIYGGIHDFHRWKPRGKYSELVTHPVPCAPCFVKTGCEGMECIRDVSPDRVYEAGEILIALRNAFPER